MDRFFGGRSVEVAGAVSATNGVNATVGSVTTEQDIYFNPDGPDASRNIYFYEDGIPTGASIRWNTTDDRFDMTHGLSVDGAITAVNGLNATLGSVTTEQGMFVNADGPDGNRHFYFYEDGIPTGESFYWNDGADAFYVTDGFIATGELRTHASQIVINDDGPNGNQDIEFFNGSTQTERFQWDAKALRFEVSDDFYAFGSISGDVKNFVQNHPYREDLEIVYTSIEGNEVTTFTRGSGRLAGGEARIELEESFRYVTNPDIGLSAHLTPRGAASDLYVASITTDELVVRSANGSDVVFDFIVYGLRIGYEEHPVYRARRAEAFAPPLDRFDADLSASPELRSHTALHRYREMGRDVFGETAAEMPRALALREAIGMRELNLDYPAGSAVSVREMNRREADKETTPETRVAARESTTERSVSESGENPHVPIDVVGLRGAGPTRDDGLRIPVDRPVEPGDVLVIDPLGTGGTTLARNAAETTVFGVVIEDDTTTLSNEDRSLETPVAVTGIVLCKVDAAWGAIRPGDLLTTSPTPGHAMRAENPGIGSVLGKALEPLDVGTGRIRVLVTLR